MTSTAGGGLPHQLLILSAIIVLIVAPANLASAESPGQWTKTTTYPIQVAGESCVAMSTSVYCVGGFDSNDNSYGQVYYATLSASGIGSWSSGPSYPTTVDSASCVNGTSGIYCVGGETGSGPTSLSDVYFAPASPSGLGSWSSAAAYPNALAGTSCVEYSGYIYCVGGFDSNGNEVSSAYYASTSPSLSSWSGTTQYPSTVDRESCTVYASDIYCFGGETEIGSNQNSPITNGYYAPLSSSGIGQWTAASFYPTALAAQSCAQYSGWVYCIGGFDSNLLSSNDAYFGQTSSSGVGSWTDGAHYPMAIDTSSCVAAMGYVYCVAGNSVTKSSQSASAPTDSTYFAPVSPTVTQTSTTPEFPVTVAIPVALAFALLMVGGLGRLATKGAEANS